MTCDKCGSLRHRREVARRVGLIGAMEERAIGYVCPKAKPGEWGHKQIIVPNETSFWEKLMWLLLGWGILAGGFYIIAVAGGQ